MCARNSWSFLPDRPPILPEKVKNKRPPCGHSIDITVSWQLGKAHASVHQLQQFHCLSLPTFSLKIPIIQARSHLSLGTTMSGSCHFSDGWWSTDCRWRDFLLLFLLLYHAVSTPLTQEGHAHPSLLWATAPKSDLSLPRRVACCLAVAELRNSLSWRWLSAAMSCCAFSQGEPANSALWDGPGLWVQG